MEPELEIRKIIGEAIQEYTRQVAEQKEPAVKAELAEERKRRELLERRLNELVEENDRHRKTVEQTDRFSTIRGELQQLGVKKPDLAFRVVKDEIFRGDDGRLYGRGEQGPVALQEFLGKFIADNPEFLPARISGGSGASGGNRQETETGSFDLSRIRPGMSPEDMERARKEIARVAGKDAGGWL